MSQAIIQEIINDIIAIDPDLKNIKSELEKLIQELIANRPETPFTLEFKESLKSQIIGAINEQKIIYEEKQRDRASMLHSIKFWMIGVSSLATCFLVFAIFQYFDEIQQPTTQITYIENIGNNELIENSVNENESILKETNLEELPAYKETANNTDNIIMDTPNNNSEPIRTEDGMIQLPDTQEYSIMTRSAIMPINEETINEKSIPDVAIAGSALSQDLTTPTSPTFCKTSQTFLNNYNLAPNFEETSKTFTYNNQIYIATISLINNNINIKHIGTQDDSQIQTELPNLNLFFDKNYFNISADYNTSIIDESDTFIEYYFPRNNQQEGITAQIDKTTNIIFSIQNICVY